MPSVANGDWSILQEEGDCTETSSCPHLDVRLTSYPRGSPMVYLGGEWHPMCYLDFNSSMVDSICKKMGYLGEANINGTSDSTSSENMNGWVRSA